MSDLQTLGLTLLKPFAMILEPEKRLFWGNILGSLVFVLVVSGSKRWSNFKILFDRTIWWHPSSRADMKIIFINTFLRGLVFSGTLVTSTAMAAALSLLLTRLAGGKLGLEWPAGLVIGLYALILFVVDDFARFYLHLLQHRWRWLWVFHQTHHSALVLTPLTLMRSHPVDILAAQARDVLVFGTVSGFFFFAFGDALNYGDLFAMQAFGLLFNLMGANIRHSQVHLHFGKLEGILISPAAHQVHHSIEPQHYDKNFGVCLALWDRLWGTFVDPRPIVEPLKFGLKDSPLSSPQQRILTLYWQPFKDLRSTKT